MAFTIELKTKYLMENVFGWPVYSFRISDSWFSAREIQETWEGVN